MKIVAIVASNNKNSYTHKIINQVINNIITLNSNFNCEIIHLLDYNIIECKVISTLMKNSKEYGILYNRNTNNELPQEMY